MKEIRSYVANDGTVFNCKSKCEQYEYNSKIADIVAKIGSKGADITEQASVMTGIGMLLNGLNSDGVEKLYNSLFNKVGSVAAPSAPDKKIAIEAVRDGSAVAVMASVNGSDQSAVKMIYGELQPIVSRGKHNKIIVNESAFRKICVDYQNGKRTAKSICNQLEISEPSFFNLTKQYNIKKGWTLQ